MSIRREGGETLENTVWRAVKGAPTYSTLR